MVNPWALFRLFSVSSNKHHYKFYDKLMWENNNLVSSAGIRTHNLLIMSLLLLTTWPGLPPYLFIGIRKMRSHKFDAYWPYRPVQTLRRLCTQHGPESFRRAWKRFGQPCGGTNIAKLFVLLWMSANAKKSFSKFYALGEFVPKQICAFEMVQT